MIEITKLNPKDIREVVKAWPPMIWMKDGSVHCTNSQSLLIRTFCHVHRIPMTMRPDVWADLCEPFLDTEFGDERKSQTMKSLRENGFSENEILSIRKKISIPMTALAAITWEWMHFGLQDVRQGLGLNFVSGFLGKWKMNYIWTSEVATRPWKLAENAGLAPETWPDYEAPATGLRDRLGYKPKFSFKKASLARLVFTRPLLEEVLEENAREAEVFSAALDSLVAADLPYHNLRHVEEVFDLGTHSYRNLDGRRLSSKILESVGYRHLCWAILFHDSVHRPAQSDNEAQSARLAVENMRLLGANDQDCAEVECLILWTQRHRMSEVSTIAKKAIHDGDLGIFGLWPARYDEYIAGVRQEWMTSGKITEVQFNKGRLDFLRKILESHSHTDFYFGLDSLHSALAKENITRECEQLML